MKKIFFPSAALLVFLFFCLKLPLSSTFLPESTSTVINNQDSGTEKEEQHLQLNSFPIASNVERLLETVFPSPSTEMKFKNNQNLHTINFCNDHKIEEPSGIVYHRAKDSYFIVGDQGEIYQLNTAGKLVKKKEIKNSDFEGITVNPETHLLYVAVEGDEEILEIDPNNFKVLRKFYVNRFYQGKLVLNEDGNGIEGLTYNPHTKSFFLTNQQFDHGNMDDASAIFEVEFPNAGENNNVLNIINYQKMPLADLAAISYDTEKSIFYVVSDIHDTMIFMDKDFNTLGKTKLPGKDQEGVTKTPEGAFAVAQDTGGIVKVIVQDDKS